MSTSYPGWCWPGPAPASGFSAKARPLAASVFSSSGRTVPGPRRFVFFVGRYIYECIQEDDGFQRPMVPQRCDDAFLSPADEQCDPASHRVNRRKPADSGGGKKAGLVPDKIGRIRALFFYLCAEWFKLKKR